MTAPTRYDGWHTVPEHLRTKTQLADQISNDFLVQYMTQLQAQLGVSVNQSALAQAIGVSQPGS